MNKPLHKAIAIVGVGAVMPEATNLPGYWNNIKQGKYCISEVPVDRWNAALYYDPDRKMPDKTYSKLGGWVKEDGWDPLKWRLPIPPKVSDQMDYTQKWAITAAREALMDFGYPDKDFNRDRTAVILGVAMGGDQHLYSAARILFPEYAEILNKSADFATLSSATRTKIIGDMRSNLDMIFPGITEDTMPGELSNIVAGRIAALFNFHGPNYIADAACASAIAGMSAAIEGLEEYDYDLVVTGGIDANMAPSTFVKFSKIGALSPTGTRPYAHGADGFIMGEGGAVFILKRLEDAERDGDKIYAVIRSIGGSSDGKGKGITAPNPIGQTLAVKRAWGNAGISPATVSMIEGHGTSTTVGDAVELQCLQKVFGDLGMSKGSIALGSVKSNIGHLKGAAGAAGIMKATMALHEKVLPPSLNFDSPNAGFDFDNSPLKVNTHLRPWEMKNGVPRRCGVSAFGFGGTNFHVVMEEYIPGKITSEQKTSVLVEDRPKHSEGPKLPLRGALVKGGESIDALINYLEKIKPEVRKGWTPELAVPAKVDLDAAFRIAIDFGNAEELSEKISKAIKGLRIQVPAIWQALNANGIFFGKGKAGKSAFLFTGQGSQYVNMLKELRKIEPIVAQTFDEADKVMEPLLGKPLSAYIFCDNGNETAVEKANHDLMQTEITQPAVLTVDIALYRLMQAYGMSPDYVMGHSLGEYGALVASGAISFANALMAVSARGSEMAKVEVKDQGVMAAIFGSPEEISQVLKNIDGYVEIANMNSYGQSVIGGETEPVLKAMKRFQDEGFHVAQLPVSHAFHTQIVAPASEPLGRVLAKCGLQSPEIPIIANVTGDFYPSGAGVVPEMVKLLAQQVAAPVQFVKGVNRLYEEGVRVFAEIGPKKALNGFVRDIMESKEDVSNLFSNHPKIGALISFNQCLCGMYASGKGEGIESGIENRAETKKATAILVDTSPTKVLAHKSEPRASTKFTENLSGTSEEGNRFEKLGKLFVDFMDKANSVYSGETPARPNQDIWITGASVGLPRVKKVFQDSNIEKLLRGDQLITNIPGEFQQAMLDKNITRLVKTGKGGPRFETLSEVEEVIKLAARKVDLDIARDFGFPQSRIAALDSVSQLAIGAGIDALRDAGIPLVMHYKTTTTGTKLPDRWLLPDSMKDDTGIIFASAFPGYNAYAQEMRQYFENKMANEKLDLLKNIRQDLYGQNGSDKLALELDSKIKGLEKELKDTPYSFNRRFLLRVLSMGHSQFAEYIGAKGPNTQINSACASTTMAVGMAKDWIEAGRCKRVIIIAGDDITSDDTIDWFSSGFLAAGAAATDDKVENAALPFDKRRHGMIVGMGAVAIVVESGDSAKERGVNPICEVLGVTIANSAFHGTRLDVNHIRHVMEKLVSDAEKKWGIDRYQIAGETVFVSHETYTPARGGSASAEINALRYVFKSAADKIIIANTKGMTGHAMAVGIEDVLAIKSLETGIIPPVPNFKEIDPELGQLNLSKGGAYPIRYALRLGAGFGSQISMSLLRWTPTGTGVRRKPDQLGYAYRVNDKASWNKWLEEISGRENPEIEVIKRTLRIKDPLGDTRKDVEEVIPVEKAPMPVLEKQVPQAVELVVSVNTNQKVKERVLSLIAEKTGYPTDMLDTDLDLEADLGIDTVKQAELFAEIRGEYGIERDDNLQLSEFPTLNHIIQFVLDRRPDLQGSSDTALSSQKNTEPLVVQASSQTITVKKTETAVQQKILTLISEKTGYPEDMLDLDLDLEADLGIDTVKQAELFAEIRGEYGIERDDNLQLSDYPSLNHIIQFVHDKRPDLKSESILIPAQKVVEREVVVVSAPQASGFVEDGVKERILALISEKTGYPEDMLDLDLDLEADLGIDTVKQAELFAEIRGEYGIERDDNLQLSDYPTLNHIIGFVLEKKPELQSTLNQKGGSITETSQAPVANIPIVEDSGKGEVKARILTLISEKTGYPEDMLDLDLDLEADLGIDTVKQAELFAEIRGEYGIERDDNLQLSDYPTLNHIIGFVLEKKPELQSVTSRKEENNSVIIDAQTVISAAEKGTEKEEVKAKILGLISEKTGYPEDMLDLDLDLEADLGIDTVKQAELFAEIRGAYGIERDDNLQLSDYPTLNHIIQFVLDRRPTGKISSSSPETLVNEDGLAKDVTLLKGDIDAVDQIIRRIPVAQLRPDLKYCKNTGVEINEKSQVLLMSDQGGVGKALSTQLKKQGAKVHLLNKLDSSESIQQEIAKWMKNGPVQGVYWLPALDNEGDIAKMKYADWKKATQLRVKLLYTVMRELVIAGNEDLFLVSGTRMGGQFGYDEKGAIAPLGGAVSGFTKAYKREHPSAQVKVVDFEKSRKTKAFAELLLEETVFDPGVVEVGYKQGKRWTIGFEERPFDNSTNGMKLSKDSTFLVTGAAGSITSAITADLAAASGGIFYLLDLTPKPDLQDPDLLRFASDKDGLKRDIFSRITATGEKATPVKVEKQMAAIERRYSAMQAIHAVQAAGGTAHYYSVNLLDPKTMTKVLNDIKKKSNKIDVLMHAGGIEISHLLPDKSPGEFEKVFDIKADGWFNLLSSLHEFPIHASVVFSSIAGRFGNGGQTDYSAANDFLCKSSSNFRTTRPETRGIAIDWTAWRDIGMAARGSIPTVMKQAGIDMLPPEAGIAFIRKELTSSVSGKEIIAAQSLGMMLDEFDETGGLDTREKSELNKYISKSKTVMIQEVETMGLYSGLITKASFNPKEQGFLYDHEINGTPVLPGVMGIEAMVEASKCLYPELHLKAVEEVDFLAPFKFYRSEPRDVFVKVYFTEDNGDIIGNCELFGKRTLFGKEDEEVKTHFKARIRLSEKPIEEPELAKQKIPPKAKNAIADSSDIYKLYFHGPAYQVIEKSWRKNGNLVGVYANNLPANHNPSELETQAVPRLVELCFQTAGIWEMGAKERMGLPMHIDSLEIFKLPSSNRKRLYALVEHDEGKYNAKVVDGKGEVYLSIKGYSTAEFMSDIDDNLLKPLKMVMN
jgi:malonyl CoA-acyl carrier protein transacylase